MKIVNAKTTQSNKDNNGQIRLYILSFLLGVISCWLLQFTKSAQDIQIIYLSQDEIIELENQRINEQKLENRQMFFGELDSAIKLATTIPQSYQNSSTKLVYSMGVVSGKNVRSISKEVHQQIIKELTKQTRSVKNNG
jgi:hypothetical protein